MRSRFTARTIKVLALALFFTASLTSCTSTQVAYKFLDWGMMWYIESYVDLNAQQKTLTKNNLKQFHAWHRETQLVQYARYIDALKTRLEKPVTGRGIHAETDEVQKLLDQSFDQVIPALADLCEQLSTEQIAEIQLKLQKDQKKYQKKFVDAPKKKQYKLREKELTDTISPFFGRFTKEQKKQITKWSHSLLAYEELTLRQQQIWEQAFSKAMQHRSNRQVLEAKLKELMVYQTDNWQPELKQRLDTNQTLTYELIAELFNSRTEKQRNKTRDKLSGYISDLRELANNGE